VTRDNNYDDGGGGGGGGVSARIEGIRERKGIIPLMHNLGARYRMVSVTTMLSYSRRKRLQLPVAICGSQARLTLWRRTSLAPAGSLTEIFRLSSL
jgi:hypothetical protein